MSNKALETWQADHNIDDATLTQMVADGQIKYFVSWTVEDSGTSSEHITEPMSHEEATDMFEKYEEATALHKNIKRRKHVTNVVVRATNPEYIAGELAAIVQEDTYTPESSWTEQFEEEQTRAIVAAQNHMVDVSDAMEINEAEESEDPETKNWIRMAAAARYVGVLFQQVQQRVAHGTMPHKVINGAKHVHLEDCDRWIAARDVYFMRKSKREFDSKTNKHRKVKQPAQPMIEVDDDRVEGEEPADFSEVV